jgi:xylulokinase
MPHPGKAGLVALAVCPTGNAVLNWARDLVGVNIQEVEIELKMGNPAPSPVQAVPYLSGSMVYWEEGRKAKGALIGLTLATSQIDVVKAFMESIAYDHVNTLSLLRKEGVQVNRIRATGGGSRSLWWTQLKSDLTNTTIEVAEQQEAGTLGAAILAGMAIGVYDNPEQVSVSFSGTSRVHEPDPERAALHQDRLQYYRTTVGTLLRELY